MKGFITTPVAAQDILAAITDAFAARNLPPFWTPGAFPVLSGPHAGGVFIPADDNIFQTPLMGSPVERPMDFPEFEITIAALGGLNARVEIAPADITSPITE